MVIWEILVKVNLWFGMNETLSLKGQHLGDTEVSMSCAKKNGECNKKAWMCWKEKKTMDCGLWIE